MHKVLILFVLSALLLFASAHAQPGNSASDRLHRIFTADWEWQMATYPEYATYLGNHRYNERLTDMSMEAIESRRAYARELLEKIMDIDRGELSGQDLISYDLFKYNLDRELAAHLYGDIYMPINQVNGVQLSFASLMSVMPLNTATDFQNYLTRLEAFPRYIDQLIALMEQGIEGGWVQVAGPLASVPAQIAGQITDDVSDSPLYAAFQKMPVSITPSDAQKLVEIGRAQIAGPVFSALRKLHDFMAERYIPACRIEIGAINLPAGADYYQHKIKDETTTELTAKEIHEMGLREVERIRAEMVKAIETSGFKGSFDQFLVFLRTDPQFYYSAADALVTGYRDISKRADAGLPALFAELPRNTYGVRAFADYESPAQTTARYYSGASDGSRPGYFMVNTYKLETRPKYEMEALTLHEAVPGHHLQIARAAELRGLPDFRRNNGYNAYVEGWALYAESLGEEMGFYTDPYSKFGQLTYEMWRACRLVVDTGMHIFGWTRDQAIKFMSVNTAKSENDIIVEIDRYIVWPGQALGYKIGELRIKELRKRAAAVLGEKFDIRRFHNALLDDGSLPLDILEQRIDAWIAAEQRRVKK